MPELPDLHVYSINLKKRILDKNIASVTICNPRKFDTPNTFCQKLTGTNIQDIVREGKELYFLLANQNSFSVHLMLNGKFFIVNQDATEKISGKILALNFEASAEAAPEHEALVIADYQGLCKISLNPKATKSPDALSDKFTFEYFAKVLQKNAPKNIKAVLIDQNVVRGIGNAYVDEILWKADISPESVSGKIPEEKLKDLYKAIPFILNDAIQNILKLSPDIIGGEERSFLKVHNPRKKQTDNGDKIIVKTVASKTTYFTDKQKLYI
jgi:formamidopyrimidine-DNA glycosylase